MIAFLFAAIAIACLIYAVCALFAGKLPPQDLRGIPVENQRRFCFLSGLLMLAQSIVMGLSSYWDVTGHTDLLRLCAACSVGIFLILALIRHRMQQ